MANWQEWMAVVERIVNKKEGANVLNLTPDKYFWTKDGKGLRNLTELLNELKVMPHETFHHHVNIGKNDFANWIADVLQDSITAKAIRGLRTKTEHINVIERFHKWRPARVK